MIIKSYETANLKLNNNFYLLYGKNEGLKKEIIEKLIGNKKEISIYEEKEILEGSSNFIENILTNSLFDSEKIVLIKRASDKVLKLIEEINEKKVQDLAIILDCGNLEKKSKLRNYFEKHKKYVCLAVYPDDDKVLTKLAINFFKEKKIFISTENINLIVAKSSGDRLFLKNELKKIQMLCVSNKKINNEILLKLINLSENHSISQLVDYCLAKNQKKTINILNENNFANEDCILIVKTFLNKSKKILKLSEEFNKNNNIETTISSAKPPIFWKDKEITKKIIYEWEPENIKKLIYELFEIELLIKKNLNNSVNLITNFIIQKSKLSPSN